MSILKKVGIVFCSIVIVLYVLFLLSPLVVSPILNSKSEMISDLVKKSTGFETNLDGISLVTSWNLAAGVKIKEIKLTLPKEQKAFFYAQNSGVKLSLLSLLTKKIQLESVFSDAVYADILIKEDGSLMLLDYLPKTEESTPESFELPMGIKLSNHLPNLYVKTYRFAVIDNKTQKSYFMEGDDFKVTNFILDKRIKFSSKGKIVFDEKLISKYDIKIDNKIMPNLQFHDLVFPPDVVVEPENKQTATIEIPTSFKGFTIIDIFKTVLNNGFGANLTADIKTKGNLKNPHIDGHILVDSLTVAISNRKLPESHIDLVFSGNKTTIDSEFFTSYDKSEITKLIGTVRTGKKPLLDLVFKSNAKFQNIIDLMNSVAVSLNIHDLKTLSSTGGIDADFNIRSNFKNVVSNGYLKVLPSSLSYGLYNVKVTDITANIDLNNNDINIKDTGFSILGQPLKLSGSILSDTTTDIKLIADRLPLKGLLTAAGQLSILKDNNINSGKVSIDVVLKGKFQELKPKIAAILENINIYNNSAQAKIQLQNALVNILYDGKTASGDVDVNLFAINAPGASISVPTAKVVIDPNSIDIKNSYLMLNNSRIDIIGSVKDYMNDKMAINIKANGNLQSSDLAKFLPNDFTSLISYKGKIPVNIAVTGNSKVQNIKASLVADPTNYISLIDLKSLKGQKTKINSSIEIIGDSLTLSDTEVSNGKSTIISVSGGVSKLYSTPKLNLNISVPNIESFPIWGVPNSNISANGNVTVGGDVYNPTVKGTVNVTDISIKDIDFSITDMVADLSGAILNGTATAKQFKVGGIIATDLSGNFSLKDYSKFYLTDVTAKAFDGNVSGKLSYDIPTFKAGIEFTGNGLNSTKAVEGAVGIKKALTGTMGFNGRLIMQGVTDKDLINSMKGNIDFNIEEGRFVSIGKLENLVAAQNVTSNSILKSAISALSTLATIQEADKFKSINGEMTFANGIATLSKVLVSGPSMAYYVKGTYNILPNTANLIILGRLDSKVVSVLGPLGQLSAEKLLSYIPKFGAATASLLNQITSNPANENTDLIPALSSGSTSYKDFKVVFNGPVENSSSVKSFKWLSTCDTSEMNLKVDLQNAADAVKQNITNTINDTKTKVENVQKNVTTVVETQKNKAEELKNNIQQTKNDIQTVKQNSTQSVENLKNLFQNAIKNSQNKVQTTQEAPVSTTSTSPEGAATPATTDTISGE